MPKEYTDYKGRSVAAEYVKPYDRKRDEIARRILKRWEAMEVSIAKCKADTLRDIEQIKALSGGTVGGDKGGCQFMSFDNLIRVKVHAREFICYDDRARQAQELLVAYAKELETATDNAEIVAIINAAFTPARKGLLSRARIADLYRLNIKSPKWVEAINLLRDAEFVSGGKTYIYVGKRASTEVDFTEVLLDIAVIQPACKNDAPVLQPT